MGSSTTSSATTAGVTGLVPSTILATVAAQLSLDGISEVLSHTCAREGGPQDRARAALRTKKALRTAAAHLSALLNLGTGRGGDRLLDVGHCFF